MLFVIAYSLKKTKWTAMKNTCIVIINLLFFSAWYNVICIYNIRIYMYLVKK